MNLSLGPLYWEMPREIGHCLFQSLNSLGVLADVALPALAPFVALTERILLIRDSDSILVYYFPSFK